MDQPGQLTDLVQAMLRGTDGSALQRERVAAHVRELLLAAPIDPADARAPDTAASLFVEPAVATAAQRFVALEPPKFAGFGDLQSPDEFLDRLDSFCLLNGVKPGDRLTHVVPAALEGSAKLWFRFTEKFADWAAFAAAFRGEFAPIDVKKRLKEELRRRTQHPEENLKQFIYVIAAYYQRLGEPVTDVEKVNRVLRQMHPQFHDMVEGKTFANLEELAQAADGLMERAWRRMEYVPPPQPSTQVARDLAFHSRFPTTVHPAALPAAPAYCAALATTGMAASHGQLWPLHPAALQPSFYRDQIAATAVPRPPLHAPSAFSLQHNSVPGGRGMQVQCHCCGGMGHVARQCPTGKPRASPRCFRCGQVGHVQARCPGNWRQ